jgi:hypothetical protein
MHALTDLAAGGGIRTRIAGRERITLWNSSHCLGKEPSMLIPLCFHPTDPDWTALLSDWLDSADPQNSSAALVVDEAGQVIGVVGSEDPQPVLQPAGQVG